jgi:hypothetical protein
MPSSPLSPSDTAPESVRDREEVYVEFGRQREKAKGRRTLEWACASARVAGSGKENENCRVGVSMALGLDKLQEEGDETDEAEDDHEAVTPGSSFTNGVAERNPGLKAMIQDEDMMAAYILCGLGLGLR